MSMFLYFITQYLWSSHFAPFIPTNSNSGIPKSIPWSPIFFSIHFHLPRQLYPTPPNSSSPAILSCEIQHLVKTTVTHCKMSVSFSLAGLWPYWKQEPHLIHFSIARHSGLINVKYVCVCPCVYMSVCVHDSVFGGTWVFVRKSTCSVCAYGTVYESEWVHVRMCVWIYMSVYECMSGCAGMCESGNMSECVYLCESSCVFMLVCIQVYVSPSVWVYYVFPLLGIQSRSYLSPTACPPWVNQAMWTEHNKQWLSDL